MQMQRFPLLIGASTLAALTALAAFQGGAVLALLTLAGALAGASLLKSNFGFAGSWRGLVLEGRTHGLRIQLLLFAVVGAIALPLMADGTVRGALAPVGFAVVLGAFLFGVGMQISGVCASGALFVAGGGSMMSWVTLIGFVIGVTGAAATFDTWSAWPIMETVSLTHRFGGVGAVAIHLALVAVALALAVIYERARRGHVAGLLSDWTSSASLTGRWPLIWGAIGLGAAALAILLLSGRPWALISAYALLGSKIVAFTGEDVAFWGHWASDPAILDRSIFSDPASMIDLGAILGAMVAAAATGVFRLRGERALRPLLLALLGGVVMGFGARLSVGCNIGAFFSGIISGSLHGWVWGVFALAGTATAIGGKLLIVRLRDRAAAAFAVSVRTATLKS